MAAKILLGKPPTAPLRFSPDMENVPPDEADTLAGLEETLRSIVETTSRDYGETMRPVHAKSTGLLTGAFTVLDDLPAQLTQGLFARGGTYPLVMRLSTAPGDLIADSISGPRGIALKVGGVQGEAPDGSASGVQDFLMVDGPAFVTPTPKDFLKSLRLLATTTDKAEFAKKILSAALRGTEAVLESLGGESALLKSTGGHPITHPLGETYFSQTPYRYGDYIAKFALLPASPALHPLIDTHLDLKGDENGLRSAVGEFFATQGAEWEFAVQLCTDMENMPIEDASVPWPMDKSAYVTVARIKAPAQSVWDADKIAAIDKGLSFSPWHCLPAHRPLGGINRVRRQLYEIFAGLRGGSAGCPFHRTAA